MQESYISFDNKARRTVAGDRDPQWPASLYRPGRPALRGERSNAWPAAVEKPASNENEQQQTLLSAWLSQKRRWIDKAARRGLASVRPPSPLAVFERSPQR